VSDVAETVDDVAPESVTEVAEETAEVPPKWAEPLLEKVDTIAEAMHVHPEEPEAEATEETEAPEVETEVATVLGDVQDSAPNEPVKDVTPESVPWTHRNPFGKD